MLIYLQHLQLTKYVIHCLFQHTYVCIISLYYFFYTNNETAQLSQRRN